MELRTLDITFSGDRPNDHLFEPALELYGNSLYEGLGPKLQAAMAWRDCIGNLASTNYVATEEYDMYLLAIANMSVEPDMELSWLNGLAVDPQQRHRGIGTYVVRELFAIARSGGCKRMRLRPLESSIGFHHKLGFRVRYYEARSLPVMEIEL